MTFGGRFRSRSGKLKTGVKQKDSALERDHLEAWDGLEVLHVERSDIEADIQGRSPDNQVFQSDGDSFCRLLALDASGKLRDSERDWMHDHVAGQLVGEGFAAHLVGVGSGPVNAVRKLDDADGGEGAFYVAVSGANALDDLLDGLAAPFACDQDAGV